MSVSTKTLETPMLLDRGVFSLHQEVLSITISGHAHPDRTALKADQPKQQAYGSIRETCWDLSSLRPPFGREQLKRD